MQLKYPLCCHCSWVIDAFHFVYQQDGDKEFIHFSILSSTSSNGIQSCACAGDDLASGRPWRCEVELQQGRGRLQLQHWRGRLMIQNGFGRPAKSDWNLLSMEKMKHNKWNFKGCPPSGQKPEVLMSYFLSLIYVVECFGENWAKPLQPKKFTSGEISGISLISRLNHSRPNFWSAGDPGIHILSYIIIYYRLLSYTIIYYHIISYLYMYIRMIYAYITRYP